MRPGPSRAGGLLAAVFLAVSASAATADTLAIGNYHEVRRRPLGPRLTLFTYQASLTNSGPALHGATALTAHVQGRGTGMVILDRDLTFGGIPSNATMASLDTFSFLQVTRRAVDLSQLSWTTTGIPDQAPIANAGPDQTLARPGLVVSLDGSRSSDADGDPLTFRWTLESVPPASQATLSDPAAVNPTFTADLSGSYVARLIVNDGLVDSASDTVVISTLNAPPVADAGPDQTVVLGATVTLAGSRSSDADGDPLRFAWTFLSRPPGSTAALSDPTAVDPTFVADQPGAYELQLIVDDGLADSAPDTVEITTENSRPLAHAGADQTVALGADVTLDGSASTDVDGDPLTYAWTITYAPPGSTAALDDPAAVRPRFRADLPGTYVAQLVVSDGGLSSVPDTVTVTTQNSRPVADAGEDQTVRVGQLTVLTGEASSDADGDPLTFDWSLTVKPEGSAAALQNPTDVRPLFTPDQPGAYVAQLVVNDGTARSDPDTVTISTTNSTPVANAGEDQEVPVDATVTLDGTGSHDADGQTLTYQWSLLTRPAGSLAVLSDPTLPDPTFVADLPGFYVAQLIVNDGLVNSAPDTVTMTTVNRPPVAEAGPDQAVATGATAQLDGSASSDPDGTPLQFSWSFARKPAGSEAKLSAGSRPSFVADLPGEYVIELVVSDGELESPPDSVTITAGAPLVTVTVTDGNASEAGPDPGTFVVTRAGPTTDPLTVEYQLEGSATNGTDYAALPTTVTLLSGETSATITIQPIDDTEAELTEFVLLTVVPRPQYAVGTTSPQTMAIADNDAFVGVSATVPTVDENGPAASAFTVSRIGPTAEPLTVSYSVTGTATAAADYIRLAGSVTIPAGSIEASVTLTPLDDPDLEGLETVILTLEPGDGYTVGALSGATVTIVDDERPVVTVTSTDSAAEIGPHPGTFTLARTGPTTFALTVFYTMAGSARNGIDYAAVPTSLTIPAGSAAVTLTITPIADTEVEGTEFVDIVVDPSLAYVVGIPGIAVMSLTDSVVLTVEATDPDASEVGPDPGAFTFTRTGGDLTTALAFLVSRSGTASGGDYSGLGGGIVTIPAGQASVAVPITPLPDNLVEGVETLTVTIVPAAAFTIGGSGSATLTIADDPAVVGVTPTDPDAAELGADPGVFTFTRSGGNLAAALTVLITIGGTAANSQDYAVVSGVLTIPAGQPSATAVITPSPDNQVEGAETVVVTLRANPSYVIGSPDAATVTIADDPAVVTIVASDPDASETGPDPGVFTIFRTGGSLAEALTLFVTRSGTATNGTDYPSLGGSTFLVTIPAGDTVATVTITPIDDGQTEPSETVVLALNASTKFLITAPGTATVTITDND
jgi:hypothetical protein